MSRESAPLSSATLSTHNPRLLRTPEAARLLGLAPSTLAKLRCIGGGPGFIRLGGGRAVAYRESDLVVWTDRNPTLRSTSDGAAPAGGERR